MSVLRNKVHELSNRSAAFSFPSTCSTVSSSTIFDTGRSRVVALFFTDTRFARVGLCCCGELRQFFLGARHFAVNFRQQAERCLQQRSSFGLRSIAVVLASEVNIFSPTVSKRDLGGTGPVSTFVASNCHWW